MLFDPPRTMMEFFRKSQGIWYSVRTVHHFDSVEDESGKSKLHVQAIEPNDEQFQVFCQQQQINPVHAAGGARFMWQEHKDMADPNPEQAAVLIDVPDDASGRSGKLLRNQGYVEKTPVVSRYWFGQDGILTIDTEYVDHQGQERCWFMTDNFRVRVTTVRMMGGVFLMAYCSETRLVSETELAAMAKQHYQREVGVP